ncbi:MAG: hypothetical protein AAF560_34330, partial [Acidobacteriota bacterium]
MSRRGAAAAVWVGICLAGGPLAAGPAAAASVPSEVDPAGYLCRSLPSALRDLEERGMPLVFSSHLVHEGMQVRRVPASGAPRRVLEGLLAPYGLRAQDGSGGRVLIVRDFEGVLPARMDDEQAPRWVRPNTGAADGGHRFEGVLPAWIDRGNRDQLAVVQVREDAALEDLPPSPSVRYLVLRVVEPPAGLSWQQLAFRLKSRVVEARAASRALRVGLEAAPEVVDRLLEQGLAPYVDAYVFSGPVFSGHAAGGESRVPQRDPTARLWWRPVADDRPLLQTLLQGAALDAELVLLADRSVGAEHRDFLRQIQATPSVDLEVQPKIEGVDPARARVLYDLERGSYYLALYGDLEADRSSPQRLALSVGEGVTVRGLFPEGVSFSQLQLGGRTELEIADLPPYTLLELLPARVETNSDNLWVGGLAEIDPYELVVWNQVFQEREARKVDSLVVLERRQSVSQTRAARQYAWHHRIVERRGKLTEFHHLGIERNGVPIPERKLRVGRDFRTEAQVELGPLEIELDRTYRFELLGEEDVDGWATWKVAFEPLAKGSFLS